LENLIGNLQNFDQEERYIVKLIIHKLYGASLFFRQTILRLIENKLIDIVYNTQKSSDILSVNEILEILSKFNLFIRVYNKWDEDTFEEEYCDVTCAGGLSFDKE
jgi:hypothetical protein